MESLLIAVLLCSAAFSFLLNKIFIKYSLNLGVSDSTDEKPVRWGSTNKPTVGGLSFYITFILAAVIMLTLNPTNSPIPMEFLGLVAVVTLGFLIGLSDDAYNIKPQVKLMGQLSCTLIMIFSGIHIQLTGLEFIDYGLTLLWVIGIMNAVNLLDNMDGVTGLTSLSILVTTLTLINVFHVGFDPFYFVIIAAVGAIAGFLILNWKPSKLYMGDTGSQFLGALLAFIGVKYLWNIGSFETNAVTSMQFITPIMVFIVPIMDTTFVTFARIRRGQSPFVGGRDHLAHHMTFIGISEGMVPLVLGMVSLFSGVAAIFADKYILFWNHFYTAIFSGYILVTFGTFFYFYKRGEKVAFIKARISRTMAMRKNRENLAIREPERLPS